MLTDLIGKQLGQYHIERKIGQGGMATVFRAYQPSLDRYVAIKVLPPAFVQEDPKFASRFQHEARSIARLKHPNILPIHDFGSDRDYTYIVMPYVESGQTLRRLMNGPLSQEQAVALIIQVCGGLDYAHRQGIVHRDVKPSNVLVDNGWPLLSDLGLAKVQGLSGNFTSLGSSPGTPAYMSPEQGYGEPVDQRTDIYALGVILFEMLTGTIPHAADNPWAIIARRNTLPPPDARSINPTIPPDLARIVSQALARRAEDRYQSVMAFATALEQYLAGRMAPSGRAEEALTVLSRRAVARPLGQSSPRLVWLDQVVKFCLVLMLVVVFAGGGWRGRRISTG